MGRAGYCRRVCCDYSFGGVMKTDRELLELAAKAEGRPIKYMSVIDGHGNQIGDKFIVCWNPLTDDGDALRLASTLEMMIDFMDCRVCAGHAHPEVVIDFDDGDHKRAIVLAAAAIGEAL